ATVHDPNEAVGHCVFPDRQARARRLPCLHRVGVAARPLGDPAQQLKRRGGDGRAGEHADEGRHALAAIGVPCAEASSHRSPSSRTKTWVYRLASEKPAPANTPLIAVRPTMIAAFAYRLVARSTTSMPPKATTRSRTAATNDERSTAEPLI